MPEVRTLILAVRPAVALLGAVLLAWDWWEKRLGRRGHEHLRDRALAVLGVLAFACWWNLGAFHFSHRYVHTPEFFHYYLGAKYFDEIGYTRLYDCAAAVEIEQGRGVEVARRWIRDLSTNELRRGSPVLAQPDLCRAHFSDRRWTEFSADVEWFRQSMPAQKWREVQVDHGYNGSPVWRLSAAWLARGPASAARLRWLALLDPVLLAAMWSLVLWAFGWRVTCVALLWWGTNAPAGFTYIGGAFLRADWLLLTVAAVVFSYRNRPFAAGFALGWAALLRVFPILLAAGLLVRACRDLWTRETLRPDRFYTRFALGLTSAAGVMVIATIVTTDAGRAKQAWLGFVANTTKHVSSRGSNHLGLQPALSFSAESRSAALGRYWLDTPWDTWMSARDNTLRERRPWMVAIMGAFLIAFAVTAWRQPDWAALALGVTLVPVLLDLSNYYYGFLLVLAFLWPSWPLIGVGLCTVAAISDVALAVSPAEDDRAMITSVAILIFVSVLLVSLAFARRATSVGVPVATSPG